MSKNNIVLNNFSKINLIDNTLIITSLDKVNFDETNLSICILNIKVALNYI